MPRIVGVDIPKGKRIEVALTYIYGVGPAVSKQILGKAEIEPSLRAKDLTEGQISKLNSIIGSEFMVEGDLRREISGNIKRLISISSYRGVRHKRGLPVRGQRTSTNARTRKGPKKTIGVKRKK